MAQAERLDSGTFTLIPVAEFEPAGYAKPDRCSPYRLGEEAPGEWNRYWLDSLSDSGIKGLHPIQSRSWMVSVDQLNQPPILAIMLRKLIERHHVDDALTNPDCQPVIDGGLALVRRSSVLLEPQCCVDLTNHSDWRDAAEYRGSDWQMLWIGHPWSAVRYQQGWLQISDYLEETEDAAATWAVRPDDLDRAVDEALAELERFAHRLQPVLEQFVEPWQCWALARQLAGLG